MTSNAVTLMIMWLAISSALENHENLTELQRTAQSNAFVTTGYGNSCILEIVDRLTSQCHRTAELVMAMTMAMAMAPEDTFSHLSHTGKRTYKTKLNCIDHVFGFNGYLLRYEMQSSRLGMNEEFGVNLIVVKDDDDGGKT
uniref:Uncharacterized protein n=1 Tax=Glossina pallidipes TaxID=7398 RepID=A0A1A9ZE87_GLOPL